MGYQSIFKATDSEVQILETLQAIKNFKFSSVRAAAHYFEVSRDTLIK